MTKHEDPQYQNDQPHAMDFPIGAAVTYTGKRSRAVIYLDEHGGHKHPLGVGVAMRRKGDKRDDLLGINLALMRAFQAAAHSVQIRLLADGHREASGLPRKEVSRLQAEWRKAQQDQMRSYQEAMAQLVGVPDILIENDPQPESGHA